MVATSRSCDESSCKVDAPGDVNTLETVNIFQDTWETSRIICLLLLVALPGLQVTADKGARIVNHQYGLEEDGSFAAV